jgi:hypothetical protein
MMKIPRFGELYRRIFYVPYYCKFPALIRGWRGSRCEVYTMYIMLLWMLYFLSIFSALAGPNI